MSEAGSYVDAPFYAQVEPIWGYDNGTLPRKLRGAKVARLSQRYPSSPLGGTVLLALTLRIPAAAFQPLRPAVVVVPDGTAQPVLMEVAQ